MELARRHCLPPLLLLCLLVALLGGEWPTADAAIRRNHAPTPRPTPTPTPAPAPARTPDPRFVIDAPQRCPDGQAAYNNNCRTLRGPQG